MRNPFSTGEPSPAEKFERFVELERQAKPYREAEQQRIIAHGPDCFGAYGSCISCGCYQGNACVSHAGSPRHMAALKEREIKALEAIAAQKQESR